MENCNDSDIALLMQIASMVVWFSGTAWWIINCRYINQRYTKPIHLILSCALVFRSIEEFFSYLILTYCASSYSQYYDLGLSSAYTLYNTFLYTLFLLVSKGLSLTRDYLERNEISIIALTMGVIYLGFSAYTIDRENLKVVLMLMLGVLGYTVYTNSSKVISTLRHRYQMMRANNLTGTLEAIKTKISMLRLFRLLIGGLCGSQLVCVAADFVIGLFADIERECEEIECGIIMEGVMDFTQMVGVLGVCVVFMPRYRGAFFEIAEFDNENEMREITPMYEAVLPPGTGSVDSEKPLVLVKPSGEALGMDNVYNRVMIAMPMSQTYGPNSADGLREPLLASQFK